MPPTPSGLPSRNRDIAGSVLLIAVVLLTYLPALHGGMQWDDQAHLTRPDLQSWSGLWKIWFVPGSTQQYYPMLHSAFWLLHHLFSDDTLGYHLITAILHGIGAGLLWRVLRRLGIPGGYLAAMVFALHPVQVESVAWMSELKNTLSGVCYFGAALCYLRFDAHRERRWYVAALTIFVIGLLTKTVIATLPAALLLLFWWRRGSLDFRRDVRPTMPFFLIGAVAGITTAIVEAQLIGARSSALDLDLAKRILISGRVIWFYAGKALWPTGLSFFYPRWVVDPAVLAQWLYPVAVLVVLALAWRVRRRSRAPLAASLFFVGTLFPVLGFLDIYPFRFSFVADHFQYLAILGVIVPLSAGAVLLLERRPPFIRRFALGACALTLGGLALLSQKQSTLYGADEEHMYRAVLAQNPASWLAEGNLGASMLARGAVDSAVVHLQAALRLNPNEAEAYADLGTARMREHRAMDAVELYSKAVSLAPGFWRAQYSLAEAYSSLAQYQQAIVRYHETIRLQPEYIPAHFNLGISLAEMGMRSDALRELDETSRIARDSLDWEMRLANVFVILGDRGRAEKSAMTAMRLAGDPGHARQMRTMKELADSLAGVGPHDKRE